MATLTAQLQESAFSKVLACLVLGGYTLVRIGTTKQHWPLLVHLKPLLSPLDLSLDLVWWSLVTRCHAHKLMLLQDKERLMLELRELLVISEQQYIGIRGEIEAQRRHGSCLQLAGHSPEDYLQQNHSTSLPVQEWHYRPES